MSYILKSCLSSSTTAAAHDTDDLTDEGADSDHRGDQDHESDGGNDSGDGWDPYNDTSKSFVFIMRPILDHLQ